LLTNSATKNCVKNPLKCWCKNLPPKATIFKGL
jgi:hypothetical protein